MINVVVLFRRRHFGATKCIQNNATARLLHIVKEFPRSLCQKHPSLPQMDVRSWDG